MEKLIGTQKLTDEQRQQLAIARHWKKVFSDLAKIGKRLSRAAVSANDAALRSNLSGFRIFETDVRDAMQAIAHAQALMYPKPESEPGSEPERKEGIADADL